MFIILTNKPIFFSSLSPTKKLPVVSILRGPGKERIMDFVPGWTELKPQVKTGSEKVWNSTVGIVGLCIITLTDGLAPFKAAGRRSR